MYFCIRERPTICNIGCTRLNITCIANIGHMILLKNLLLAFFSFLFLIITGCGGVSNKNEFPDSDMYNFSNPKVVNLPEELDEISGIAYYPKDTSVFAIIDEDGVLFKIPVKHPNNFKKWKFDKKRDFEDIVLADSTFYVLVSNGDIETIKFNGDQIQTSRTNFSDFSPAASEFEILYLNDSATLVMACKTCEGDSKKSISRFSYNFKDSSPVYQPFPPVDMSSVAERLGITKHLKASAAAINPLTHDLYIISSIQKLIVIFDEKGAFKELYKLNPAIYKQPEGIAFTPNGDLIISNEFAENGFATLLLLKNKKKRK